MRALPLFFTAAVLTASAAHAQGVAAVLEANRIADGGGAWPRQSAAEVRFDYAGQGMTGAVGSVFDVSTGAFVDTASIGPTTQANGFDGAQAWMRDMSGAVTAQAGGDARQLAVNEAYRDANLWWRPDRGGATISGSGVNTDAGRAYDVLKVAPAGGKPFEAWFDTSTHLLARIVEAQGFETITTDFSDYRPINGVLFAGKQLIDDGSGPQYRQTQTLAEARFVPARPASAYAAPAWTPSDAAIGNAAGRTTVPFRLLNNHIYAGVQINGKGPFQCIFDTGGHDLLTPATAKTLSVESQGQSPGGGAGEGVVDTGYARAVSFQIGDLTLRDQTIEVLPFEAGPVEGFDEQCMIGFQVFRRFITRIDYGQKTLTFIDPAKFDPKDAGVPVPFVFYSHLPQVEGTFEGIPAKFDIDTGSRVELTLTKPFADAHDLKAKHAKGVIAVDGWGVGGRSVSYMTRSPGITLGPVKIDDLVVGYGVQSKGALSDPNYQGNVGSALLKRFVVTFDYARQVMYLKALPAPAHDTNVFDRAGMWINASAKGLSIVDVTAGGPAAAAGLKAGDEIVAVDGVAATSMALTDVRERLRNAPAGTVVTLALAAPAGAPRSVALTLKDQI